MRSIDHRRPVAVVALLLLAACATSKPGPMLPHFANADQDVFGGWIVVQPPGPKSRPIEGELIAVEPERLVILGGSGTVLVKKNDIKTASLALYDPKTLLGNVGTGMLLSLATGVLSIPLIALWSVAGGIALHDVNVAAEIDYPASAWDALGKGARFPQGLPEGFDVQQLQPRLPPVGPKR
jgi:hypothetical protein